MKINNLSEWNDRDEHVYNDFPYITPNFISNCCSARPYGELYTHSPYPPSGICSKCKDPAIFEQDIEE